MTFAKVRKRKSVSAREKMRVAFIILGFPALSETFILNQVTALLERGHEVDIFPTYLRGIENRHPDVDAYGLFDKVTWKNIPDKRSEKLGRGLRLFLPVFFKDPAMTARACNVLTNGRKSLEYLLFAALFAKRPPYDVIHAHYGHEGLLSLGLKKILRPAPPLLTSFYGFDLSRLVRDKGEDYYRPLFEKSDLLLPLSRDFKNRLIEMGCPLEKLKIQPLCVDLKNFDFKARRPPEDGVVRLLSVARLVEKKGLEYALRAVALLRQQRPGTAIKYRIIGEGPLKDGLLSLRKELGLEDTVEFAGGRSHEEVPRFMEGSHLFMLPSVKAEDGDEEGTPVCLMEAMASGMPVLSTFHSGISEVVEDGMAGFLVPERDPESLAEKLAFLIDHPEKWAEMGEAGRRKIAENHDREKVGENLENIYRELVTNHKS